MVFSGDREPKLFFKIILAPSLHDKTLKIPPKFVKEFSKDLSSMATLVVPTGKRWTVRLHCEGKDLWFRDGLSEFFEFNFVSCGYFLVFHYRGDSEFEVRIFDLSACEISYPSPSVKVSKKIAPPKQAARAPLHFEKETDDANHTSDDDDNDYDNCVFDDDVVVLDKPKPVPNLVDVVELSSDDDGIEYKTHVSNPRTRPVTRKRKIEPEMATPDVPTLPHNRKLVPRREMKQRNDESNRLSRAPVVTSTKTKNPSFKAVIKGYNVERSLFMNIPSDIGRKYPTGGSKLVKLKIKDGRTWIVQGMFLNARLTRLGQGWGNFVRDTRLQVGDICVFELIEYVRELTMQVSMFRRNK